LGFFTKIGFFGENLKKTRKTKEKPYSIFFIFKKMTEKFIWFFGVLNFCEKSPEKAFNILRKIFFYFFKKIKFLKNAIFVNCFEYL